MRRRLRLAGVLLVAALLVAGCADDDGGGGSGGSADAGESGDSSDVSLIPPSDATSPTSGPPNTDPLAGATQPLPGTCASHGDASPDSVGEALELRVQLRETLETGRVQWTLTVENTGDEAATLVYPNAQDGDVVLRQDGEVVYRWSEGMAFAQVVRCQVIGAGQRYQLLLRGSDLDVEPGDYELEATLAADPTPAPAEIDVTVEAP